MKRHRIPGMLLFAALACVAVGGAGGQEGPPPDAGAKLPLDLPSGGKGDDDDDDPEVTTITFYGSEYEGDGFFWCLDKSCSMGWGGEIETLKQEVGQALQSLSSENEFSMVAFNSTTTVWSDTPRRATPQKKAEAFAWLQALQPSGSTCIGPAGVETVNISKLSERPHKQIIVVSDGHPYCGGVDTGQQALTDITNANWQRTPIHTILIGEDSDGVEFMQMLALLNNGTFRIVP